MKLWKKMCTVLACLAGFTALGALENLPDVSTLDTSWTKDAVKIAEWSWDAVPKNGDLTKKAFIKKSPASLALPYNEQYMEFALANPETLSKIVLDADQLRKYDVKGDEISRAIVYVSLDGKNYKAIDAKVNCFFYTSTDYAKRVTLWNRVTLSGDFYGKYFRILIPWDKSGYIYRVHFGPKKVKAFAAVNLKELTVPFSTDGKFNCSFVMNGNKNIDGKVVFKVKDGAVLAEKRLSEFSDGKVSVVPLVLKNVKPGIVDLEIIVYSNDGVSLLHRKEKIFYVENKQILKPAAVNCTVKNVRAGALNLQFFNADAAGARVEYTVPVSGAYAVYAVVRGKSDFTFTAPGFTKKNVILDMWAAKYDSNQWVSGENFVGIVDFKAGDKITFTAKKAGDQLGEVFIIPATAEQQKLFNEKTVPGSRKSIIVHGDGFSDFFYKEITEKMLHDRIRSMKAGNVIAYDWCIGTSATNYPSKIGTMFGKQRNLKWLRERDRLAAVRMEKLNQTAGKDSLQILREATAKYNVRYTITLRPNAFYGDDRDKNAQYLMDHPEFFTTHSWAKKPSYAYKEIRDFYLGLAKEIAAYKPDALVIDYLRHPIYFGFDKPLVEKFTKLYGSCTKDDYLSERWNKMTGEVMVEWLREVRNEIKKIHPAIQLEVHVDCEKAAEYGTPVERFLEEGLVDVISPGFYELGEQKVFPLAPYHAMIKKSPIPVKLYPRVETTIDGHDPTPEEEAGLVKRPLQVYCTDNQLKSIYYRFMMDGADGIRPFNAGGAGMAMMLNDWAEIKRFMAFTAPLLDMRRFFFEK